jgi:hypothetical protein
VLLAETDAEAQALRRKPEAEWPDRDRQRGGVPHGRLRALPAAAEGRRRLPTLRIEHIDAGDAGVAAHPEDAWCSAAGGSLAAADKHPAPTTVVLAARVDGNIYVGITRAEAQRTTRLAGYWLNGWRWRQGPSAEDPAGAAELFGGMGARSRPDRSDRLTLAELVDRQTDFYRGWGNAAGEMLAKHIEELALRIRWVKAETPEDYDARHEIVEQDARETWWKQG